MIGKKSKPQLWQWPKGGVATGLQVSFELRTRHGIPKSGPIEGTGELCFMDTMLACYVDAQIGLMLDALKKRASEIIHNCRLGDHGWHLGKWSLGESNQL